MQQQANGKEENNEKPVEIKDGEEKAEGGASRRSAVDCTQHWEDSVYMANGQEEYKKFQESDEKSEEAEADDAASDHSGTATQTGGQKSEEEQSGAKKRGRGVNQKGANKKQKKGAAGEPQGPAGDKSRVPAKGQQVQWRALSGFVHGEVVEVLYEDRTVGGKGVKASNEDPRVVLKSSSSGNMAVHKPEAVYFD